jgi:predicted secreted protein
VVELGREDAGTTYTVHRGDEVIVSLVENQTTGYRWQVESGAPVLQMTADRYDAGGNAPGAAGTRILRFTAATPGDTELRLTSRRPWERDGVPADEFAVTIHVVD